MLPPSMYSDQWYKTLYYNAITHSRRINELEAELEKTHTTLAQREAQLSNFKEKLKNFIDISALK